jgi:dihydroneopterin aldolase
MSILFLAQEIWQRLTKQDTMINLHILTSLNRAGGKDLHDMLVYNRLAVVIIELAHHQIWQLFPGFGLSVTQA